MKKVLSLISTVILISGLTIFCMKTSVSPDTESSYTQLTDLTIEQTDESVEQPNTNTESIDYSIYDIEVPDVSEEGRMINPIEISSTAYDINVENSPEAGTGEFDISVVVFSDFECPYCAYVGQACHELLDHFDNKIKIYYKFYPLDKRCNPRLQEAERDFHYGACIYAYGAYSANNQDRFWDFHTIAYEEAHDQSRQLVDWYQEDPDNNDPYEYPGFVQHAFDIAERVGCDMKIFEEDFYSDTVRDKILQDLEEGTELEIRGTPTVYVNGYRIVNGTKNFYTIANLIVRILSGDDLPFEEED